MLLSMCVSCTDSDDDEDPGLMDSGSSSSGITDSTVSTGISDGTGASTESSATITSSDVVTDAVSSDGDASTVLDSGMGSDPSTSDAASSTFSDSSVSWDAGLSSSDTGDAGGPSEAVELGAAGDFVILAKSAVSTVPPSDVTGNIGLSPAAATFITGFSLVADVTNVFSISTQLTGRVYASDYEAPTPTALTAAIGDMELAFSDAAGRAPDVTELGAGDIGGMTLEPGVYQWGTSLSIPADVTLAGNATDVWIFQVAQDLTFASATSVLLSGGAEARNVFWQVSGLVDLGTTAHCEGVILSQTSVALRTGASVTGRLLAQTAVTIDSSTVTEPQ